MQHPRKAENKARYKIPGIDAPKMKLHENTNFSGKWTGK